MTTDIVGMTMPKPRPMTTMNTLMCHSGLPAPRVVCSSVAARMKQAPAIVSQR